MNLYAGGEGGMGGGSRELDHLFDGGTNHWGMEKGPGAARPSLRFALLDAYLWVTRRGNVGRLAAGSVARLAAGIGRLSGGVTASVPASWAHAVISAHLLAVLLRERADALSDAV